MACVLERLLETAPKAAEEVKIEGSVGAMEEGGPAAFTSFIAWAIKGLRERLRGGVQDDRYDDWLPSLLSDIE